MNKKVACLMSGGVDSSVACAILKEKRFDVIGFTLKLWTDGSRCCNIKDIYDAKAVARQLGIPHYVVDLEREFKKNVIDYFVAEYIGGKTPNPCVVCNRRIKFDEFFEKINNLGIEYVATGHYAKSCSDGRYMLKRGVEHSKDQSYFLAYLSQDNLNRVIFPLAELKKTEVRKKALELKLKVADKKESQEICFIPDNNIINFINKFGEINGGEIVYKTGKVLGYHTGIAKYTIGQRRGIRLPGAKPFYVISIEGDKNRIIIGEEADLYSKEMLVTGLNWIAIDKLNFPMVADVKIRYNQVPSPAEILPVDRGEVVVKFNIPQRAVTPGQFAVFYQEDTVIGSGWIKSSN